jgi:hypothetical protein
MASAIDIANFALTKLGDARIISFQDDNKQGRAVTALYDKVRDDELRRHLWNFAMKRVILPADADAPAWGFTKQFSLPADCLRVVQVNDFIITQSLQNYKDSVQLPYSIEGRKIATDFPAPLKVRYIYRVTDANQFDSTFVAALSARLAYELCEDLTQSNAKKQAAWQDYKNVIAEARRFDAIENPPETAVDDSWILARL